MVSVHPETSLLALDFGRFAADREERAAFASDLRTAARECRGLRRANPISGAVSSTIHQTASDRFQDADAFQSATHRAARAVRQLQRERMSP
jgi:hypothetical protein